MLSKKEFTIVDNLRFSSRTSFMLKWIEQEKKFYNLGARFAEYLCTQEVSINLKNVT